MATFSKDDNQWMPDCEHEICNVPCTCGMDDDEVLEYEEYLLASKFEQQQMLAERKGEPFVCDMSHDELPF